MKYLVFLLLPFFTSSEVFPDFSNCNEFFCGNTPPFIALPKGVSVEHICQCLFDNNNQKVYLYATLYSTTWKIPIYSAYIYEKRMPKIGRCNSWKIEPQLEQSNEPCMRLQGKSNNICTNQAVNSDYTKSGFDRGHLYPVLHTDNVLSMKATFTLTNAAPQDPTFNQVSWLNHEKAVVKDLESCERPAYVVIGVVPDTNVQIKNGVTVSKYYWRATCCWKNAKYEIKGYIGPDNNGKVQESTIEELQKTLSSADGYNVPVTIFSYPCSNSRKRPRQ